VLHGADIRLVAGKAVDPALAWRREHLRKGFLEPGADTGLVTQLGQFVGNQSAVVGKGIHQAAHGLEGRLIAPDPIQTVGNREAHANAAHQHQPAHPLRIANGKRQRDTAAKRVADQIGLFDAQCKGMSTAEVYKLLPDGLPEMDSDIEPSSGEAGEGIEQEINDILVRASIQAQMSEKPGFIPGEIQVHLNKLTNPVLPWDRILSRFMNKLAKTDYSFRKPNRRFFPDHILPTQHGQSLDDIAVAVDTSGSVTEQQFTQFLSEVHAILLKQKPKKLTLIQFDTRIRSVDELRSTQDLASVEFTGRGGTRIEPVIEWAREHKPVAMIVFTDGYFSNHNPDPKVPLVWMIHSNPNYSTDYGKVITYPLERAA